MVYEHALDFVSAKRTCKAYRWISWYSWIKISKKVIFFAPEGKKGEIFTTDFVMRSIG